MIEALIDLQAFRAENQEIFQEKNDERKTLCVCEFENVQNQKIRLKDLSLYL